MLQRPCPLCHDDARTVLTARHLEVHCPRCGAFAISHPAIHRVEGSAIWTGWLRAWLQHPAPPGQWPVIIERDGDPATLYRPRGDDLSQG